MQAEGQKKKQPSFFSWIFLNVKVYNNNVSFNDTLCLLYVIMLSILLDGTAIADDGRAVTLEDILTFFTGADRPPPLGFQPYPTLHFCNDELASAQTCEIGLSLPIIHKEYKKFDSKKN